MTRELLLITLTPDNRFKTSTFIAPLLVNTVLSSSLPYIATPPMMFIKGASIKTLSAEFLQYKLCYVDDNIE